MKIDKDIPMPKSTKEPSELLVTLRQMEVGDSAFVPTKEERQRTTVFRSASKKIARARKSKPGANWAWREVTEDGINGMRFWRIE